MTSENRGEDAAEPGDQYEGGSSAKALRLPEERGARIQTDQAKAKARKDLGKKPITGSLLTLDHVHLVAEGRREGRWRSR